MTYDYDYEHGNDSLFFFFFFFFFLFFRFAFLPWPLKRFLDSGFSAAFSLRQLQRLIFY